MKWMENIGGGGEMSVFPELETLPQITKYTGIQVQESQQANNQMPF